MENGLPMDGPIDLVPDSPTASNGNHNPIAEPSPPSREEKKDSIISSIIHAPNINPDSTALIDSGLFKREKNVTIKSPVSLLKRKKSFHLNSTIREQLATLQEETKKTIKTLPTSLNATKSGLVPFFQRRASDNQETSTAFRKIIIEKENQGEDVHETMELTLVSDEEKWGHLFTQRNWRSSKELVELMEKGIPANMRGQIWKVFLRTEEFKLNYPVGYYTSLVKLAQLARDAEPKDSKSKFSEIDKDVGRTMPEVTIFKTDEGIRKLKNILYAYALRCPDIVGYCQGMNLIGAGLLTVLEEEDAFWALCVCIESRLGYYSTMISLKVDQCVLTRMVSYKLPEIAYHLQKLDVSINFFTINWFICMFMKSPLCYETSILFWDYLFCYGDEMLFHAALEIINKKKKEILAIEDRDELMAMTLHGMCKRLDKMTFTRIVHNIGSLAKPIEVLRAYYQKSKTLQGKSSRNDAFTLSENFQLTGPEEVVDLWKIFVEPDPWDVLLTESISEVASFAHVLHLACYEDSPDKFVAHGLMSGFMHRFFDILDVNNTCNVTFKSFLNAIYTLRYGSPQYRLKLCFHFFDFDSDGRIGISDLNLGLTIISDMIEGYLPDNIKKMRRFKLASELLHKAKAAEREISLKFESKPFGIALETGGFYPIVDGVGNCDKKEVQIGWELIRINKQSCLNYGKDELFSAMTSVNLPATLTFREVTLPFYDDEDLVKEKLNFDE